LKQTGDIIMSDFIEMQLRHLVHLLGDRKGISSLEYGVLAVGIVAAVALGAKSLGSAVSTYLGTTVAALI
jgi:Flp pilus assembly pilin Flp